MPRCGVWALCFIQKQCIVQYNLNPLTLCPVTLPKSRRHHEVRMVGDIVSVCYCFTCFHLTRQMDLKNTFTVHTTYGILHLCISSYYTSYWIWRANAVFRVTRMGATKYCRKRHFATSRFIFSPRPGYIPVIIPAIIIVLFAVTTPNSVNMKTPSSFRAMKSCSPKYAYNNLPTNGNKTSRVRQIIATVPFPNSLRWSPHFLCCICASGKVCYKRYEYVG